MNACKAIGIDLGTSYASIAVLKNNKVELLTDKNGNNRMPCMVHFRETDRLYFEDAKEYSRSPNSVFDINRLIGREREDFEMRKCLRYCPFKVVNEMNKTKIEVFYENELKRFYPEEIMAMLLSKLKEIAEESLGYEVPNAVITVPACFTYSQRMGVFDAAKIAGLNVLRLMNEPTAAAFTYDFSRQSVDGEHNVVVFDIGGCSFDCSVFTFEDKILNVKSTGGDFNLGGDDFDNRMIDYCLREINLRHKLDLSRDRHAIGLLKTACELAKRELSSSSNFVIQIDGLYEDLNFKMPFTREKFEEVNEDLFTQIRRILERVLFESKLNISQIHDVILVGASTRIPRIQLIVEEFFGKKPNRSLNPDEAVVTGAALLASMLSGYKTEITKDLLVLEISPYSYGIEINGGLMATIIPKNSTIPNIHKQILTSYLNPQKDYKMLKEYRLSNGQPGVLIDIFEGENRYARENNYLGSIELPLESDFDALIEVEMDMDVNGFLTVGCFDRVSGNVSQLKIRKGHISKIEMFKLKRNAEKYAHDDEIEHERIELKNSFESFCFELKTAIQESSVINEKEVNLVVVENEIKWLEENDKASIPELELEFRKIAKFSTTFATPALLNLFKTAYLILGDTSFLFDDSRIRALKFHERKQIGGDKYHYFRQHKRKLEEKKELMEE